MTKNELLALLAELKDEDMVDDKLPKQQQEITLDYLKTQLVENKELIDNINVFIDEPSCYLIA